MGEENLRIRAGRKQYRVRCLGPGKSEHEFWSRSPSNRICETRRKRQTKYPISPMLERVEKAEPETT